MATGPAEETARVSESNEVVTEPMLERRTRRRFSVADKQRLLVQADVLPHGEQGAWLRRNGLYAAQLSQRRKALAQQGLQGLAAKPGGRKPADARNREIERLRRENARLALVRYHIPAGQLTVHQDRGAPMIAETFRDLLARFGVAHSCSRPRVSNDNAASEALFKTVKYNPDYPGRFADLDEARVRMVQYIAHYQQRPHEGIAFYTPADVFHGRIDAVHARRQTELGAHFAAHPQRYPHGAPKAKRPPAAMAINPRDGIAAAGPARAQPSPKPSAPRPCASRRRNALELDQHAHRRALPTRWPACPRPSGREGASTVLPPRCCPQHSAWPTSPMSCADAVAACPRPRCPPADATTLDALRGGGLNGYLAAVWSGAATRSTILPAQRAVRPIQSQLCEGGCARYDSLARSRSVCCEWQSPVPA